MFYRQRTLSSRSRPIAPAAETITLPASTGGVNALDPLIATPQQDCYYTFNLMPSEYGLRLRKGYREWATNIGTDPYTDVRGVIPFEGTDPANNKLFAATADGIYDVTTDGETSPTKVVTYTVNDDDAGFVTWCEMTVNTTPAETYLFVACPRNGAWQYTESTGVWARPSWTNVTVANVAFVGLHKQRLWVIEAGQADAWYSPVASVAGAFTRFVFGSKFKYGGDLVGMYNWTLDGGDGVDDYMIAIGRGGDVLVYRGQDPADATTWELTGSFFIGKIPQSRRIATEYAGELYLLSVFGVTSVRDLVSGVDPSDTGRGPSAKINRILRPEVKENIAENAWQLLVNPSDGFLQILQPWQDFGSARQYVQNLLTGAWGY